MHSKEEAAGVKTAVRVPTSERVDTAAAGEKMSEPGRQLAGRIAGTKTILVVDDDPAMRELTEAWLHDGGYAVQTAASGREACRILDHFSSDLILTDIEMPGMSGVDLLRRVKSRFPNLPALAMTGSPELATAIECLQLGAEDYLTKPFSAERLNELIKTTLSGWGNRAGAAGVGAEIAGYRLLERLGEGSTGIVYRAEKGGRQFALKTLKVRPVGAADVEEIYQRFLREAEIAGRIRHPNIVSVLEYGRACNEHVPYLVMELVEGKPLKQLLGAWNNRDWQMKAALIRQIAAALQAVHDAGLVHRDVKPANVIVTPDGMAKLTDFGLVQTPDSQLTIRERTMGTPHFMAPESFASARVDHRADVFSLGSLSYWWLTGRPPFTGESLMGLITAICVDPPVAPRQLAPAIPSAVQALLARMLKKEPDQRFQSCRDITDQIEQILAGTARRGVLSRLTNLFRTTEDWS